MRNAHPRAEHSPPAIIRSRVNMAAMLRVLVGLLMFLLVCAACSTYKSFDSVGHRRAQFAERIGAAAAANVIVPFALDDATRAALPPRRAPSELRRLNQVMELIFEKLDLHYELQPTRTAVETFSARRGNCLSFVNLFVGLALSNELNPFYVEVTDYQKWSHRAGMVISQGHIVAGMYVDGELKTYDFLPYRPKAYRAFHPIDDLQAAAHYYNNLGAEALLVGDSARARELIETAAKIAPHCPKALHKPPRAPPPPPPRAAHPPRRAPPRRGGGAPRRGELPPGARRRARQRHRDDQHG